VPTDPRRGLVGPVVFRVARAFAAGLLLLVLAGAAVVAAADVGHKDFADSGGSAVTGSKPESKVWFNDGFWWASMQPSTGGGFFIYKLDPNTDSWVSTGVALDNRNATRADTLWDGTKLYVASQNNSDSGSLTGGTARLYRFSYNASTDTYSLDNGFPATMRSNIRSETLVIAKDSTGMLWATWTQNISGGRLVYTNHTVNNNDATWSTPAILPVGSQGVGVTTDSDDISTIIAFTVSGEHRIGVFWSNQADSKDYFAWHVDGAPDTTWTAETALSGNGQADDHMNIKTDASGQLYVVVKTSLTGSNPLIKLLRRTTGGSWSNFVVGIDNVGSNTRPILELEEKGSGNILHVFMTGTRTAGTSGQSGGDIFEKTSSVSSISFPSGLGTTFIRDDASAKMNNVTSTKQNVNSTSGIVALAFNDTTDFYWHNRESLGGGGQQDPLASFTASPSSGPATLNVQFTNTSTGTGTLTYAWDFENDGTVDDTSTNPSHAYTSPGTYTAKLTVTGTNGSNSTTQQIQVDPPAGPTATFTPDADAYVKNNSSANSNFGGTADLRTREDPVLTNTTYRTYLRFKVTGLTGTVTSVKLRLYTTDNSTNTQNVYATTLNPSVPGWIETGTGSITWNNAPTIGSTLLGSSSVPTANAYNEITLDPSAINGTYITLAIKSTGTNSAIFNSKEAGSNPPQLVITQAQAGTAPTANATSATVGEDGSGPVALSGSDPETCELSFSIVTPPAHGTLGSITSSGSNCTPGSPNTDSASVTYTPAANYNGSDSFTYKVNDGTGDSSAATASLTVTSVNDIPTASNTSASTPQNTPKGITLSGGDVETCDLVFTVTQPAHGSVSAPSNVACAGSGPFTDTATVTYTPTNGYTGGDSFTYKVTDGDAADSADATVTLTVTGGSPTTITVPVFADVHVRSDKPTTNFGTVTDPLRTREDPTLATPTYRPFLQFKVPAFSGTVSSVKLRLFVNPTGTSTNLQTVYAVADNTWTETGITWNNAPAIGSSVGSFMATPTGAYLDITLTQAISPNTTYSFAIKSAGTSSAYFNSKETTTPSVSPPQLVIVAGP
jgi:PKD repeat protein